MRCGTSVINMGAGCPATTMACESLRDIPLEAA
jgi:hypothetical protein